MVRREIKSFEMEYASSKYKCEAPCSVRSALCAAGEVIDGVNFDVSFVANISADEVALAIKHIYLKFKGIEAPAEILLNGISVGELDGERLVYLIDVKDKMKLGDNRLEIKFSKEKCTDVFKIGVFAPVETVRFNNAIIDKVTVTQNHEEGSVTLGIRMTAAGACENVRAVAMLVSPAGQIYYAGLTKGYGEITVTDPLYWWPHGYGVQNLYRLTVNLYGESEIEDTAECRVGLRTLSTSDFADDALVVVNGQSIMPMGALYLPDHDPMLKSGDRKLEAYVTSAAMANYNMLVVPKGEGLPRERFFELCDMHGIIAVCELKECGAGMLDTVSRLATHPSVGLFDIIGNDSVTEQTVEALSDLSLGLDFSLFKTSVEYISYKSIPSDATVNEKIPESERNLFSYSFEALAGRDAIREMLWLVSESYPYPANLSDFGYASRLAAACATENEIKRARMARGNAGRAVFASIGDPEIAVSPSAIDSFARWKALQYASQRFFAPATVYAEEHDGLVTFSVSNERRLDFMGSVEYRIINSKNEIIHKGSETFEFEALTATVAFDTDLSNYIKTNERDFYLEYFLKEGTSTLSHKTLLFVPDKHFHLEYPGITAEITGSDRRFCITLTSKRFARGVELEIPGYDAVFSDNYFDITSNYPMKITFNLIGKSASCEELSSRLRIRTVYDLGKGIRE